MEEQVVQTGVETTSDDKLWAALAWLPFSPLYPLVAILLLLMDEKKNRPFIRYNAVLSLVAGVALLVLSIPTFGLAALGYLVFFYWAYQAFQGETVQVPVLSDWIKEQGWAK
ncbi:MAG: hypothetical protein JW934_22005 [Anaerolineae bacterium]|nr:hypothetical protein [Anaerolineae bacterium]